MRNMEYIVEIDSGEVIWISYSIKNILNSYNMLGYDKRGFHFFNKLKRNQIFEIINYESKIRF